ncbi:MAG: hypothetical protein U5L06_13830 [Rhodovibrio sp.]|nr:hypothetical protein [Rhodovibrio sp.]
MLDALELYEESLARVGPTPLLASNLAFVLNYINGLSNAAIYDGHLRFREAVAHITPQRKHPNDPTPDRRLRVGMMSPDLRAHSVARFLMPLLRAYDRTAVGLTLFANVPKPDKVTATMRQLCDHWQDIRKMPAEQVADLVRAERIDVLIDLAGHTGGNSLEVFQHKPAPVQASWLGYPNTTGLETMDYRIVDEVVEPTGAAEPFSSEKIVRLPDGFHCFEPPNPCPPVGALPSAQNGFVRFGSFNYLGKVNERVVEPWSAILKRVPEQPAVAEGARPGRPAQQPGIPATLRGPRRCARAHRDRVLPARHPGEHLELYGAVDIALDTFPYNGTTTTCEALWMGVPTIALLGPTHAARVSASLLHQIGLDDLIAESPADYVDCAVALAQNPDRMAELRRGMRARINASPLRDESGFARKFETALRDIWTTWCREGARGDDRSSVATGVAAMAGGAAWHPGSVKAPDEIRVIHNLARTGGTLIAKCLGSMDGVVLLSEAHPNGAAWIDPVKQAQNWFGLIDAKEAELIRAEDDPFQVLIALCAARCQAKGQTLLVRDWTHLDFTGVPFQTPHYELTTRDCLAGRFENVLSTATVRHPIDEWLSLDKLAIVRGHLTIDAYMRGYRAFAEVAREIGFLRYEDFTNNPDGALTTLCDRLRLPFDPTYRTRWVDYTRITGDVGRSGSPEREIRPTRPKSYDPDLLDAFQASPDFTPALEMLGYTTACPDNRWLKHQSSLVQ